MRGSYRWIVGVVLMFTSTGWGQYCWDVLSIDPRRCSMREVFDFDMDDDVDWAVFSPFQLAYTGPP